MRNGSLKGLLVELDDGLKLATVGEVSVTTVIVAVVIVAGSSGKVDDLTGFFF